MGKEKRHQRIEERETTSKNWGKRNDIKELGKEEDVTNKVTEQLLKSHQACENKTSWLNQDIHMRNWEIKGLNEYCYASVWFREMTNQYNVGSK